MSERRALIIGIDHLQIAAPEGCEAEARKFFGGLLGLEEIQKPEPLLRRGGCWFQVGALNCISGWRKAFVPLPKPIQLSR